ncbi:Druantia anti-phage system protein DruA [Limisphaera sp. 4302-co]|uniref:Druantia anti-phage system protein DruA n=1 Tax=Limisphaera sp. 4302-co TaxID=3400417 RepID=UPI003C1CBAAE
MDRTSAHSEQAWLRRVRVRLIEESERPSFDQLLEKHHYLHYRRPGGRSLRYVAELDGQWVALLSFSGAAPRVKAGDRKIGRTARQRVRRLHFVVNNSRFLVLLDRGRHPNLASRVPGLCLKRLSRDGQARR